MRFLVDHNLSPRVARGLASAGHDAVHTSAVGLARASDSRILDVAVETERIVLSADTDFGTELAARGSTAPSVVLVRLTSPRRTEPLVELLLDNLPDVESALAAGAIVVLEDDRVRIRSLPLR